MKKWFKKVLPMLAVIVFTLLASITVQAKTIKLDARTVTLYTTASKTYSSFLSQYSSANSSILTVVPKSNKITNMKSTNSSVATISVKNGGSTASSYKGIFINAKKAGTTTVSYKIGSNTYTAKITVKKYTCPFASLSLGSSNILSKVKTDNTYTMSYAKYANKSLKLNFKAKSGWTISACYLTQPGNQSAKDVGNNKTFKVTKKNSALIVDAQNTKTGQTEEYLIIFK